MRQDNKLSRMLHVLLHMARHKGVYTSEQIAAMLGTNSAVVRRTLAGLRDAGFVASEKAITVGGVSPTICGTSACSISTGRWALSSCLPSAVGKSTRNVQWRRR